jgi:hypothetical protein
MEFTLLGIKLFGCFPTLLPSVYEETDMIFRRA